MEIEDVKITTGELPEEVKLFLLLLLPQELSLPSADKISKSSRRASCHFRSSQTPYPVPNMLFKFTFKVLSLASLVVAVEALSIIS